MRPSVIWALDAFSEDFESQARTVNAIRTHRPDCDIQPVYLLSEQSFSERGYSCFLRAALKPRAYHNLVALLENEGLAEVRASGALRSPRVIVEATSEVSVCVGKLLRYANRSQSRLIAIGTHARSALARFFRASFAETLIHESSLPLLVSGPRQRHVLDSPKALLIPTDFKPCDRGAFAELVRLAQERDLTLHLIHKIPATLETNHWIKLAAESRTDLILSTQNDRTPFCEGLLDYANQLSGADPVIAILNARCGVGLPVRLTRDLIRLSPYPLLMAGQVQGI